MKILLVEDNQPTAAILLEVLTAQYYTVDVATDGEIGLELATSQNYDLILLDLLIPKLDGIVLCRQLRVQGFQKPILLLTARGGSTDVVKGLDAGADDYVTKPYDLSQLLARIRALLRRVDTPLAPAVLTWGNLHVNPIAAEVTYAEQKLSLSPKEYSLLEFFLRNPQRIFSRADLINRLWSIDASPSEGTVTNLIKDLRHKLKAAGMTTDLLETVYGLGYRLKPSLQEIGGDGERREDRDVSLSPSSLPSPPSSPPSRSLSQKIDSILERHQAAFAAQVVVLEQAEQALRAEDLPQYLRDIARQEAHKLAGTLGSFGYHLGSQLAQSIEHLLINNQIQNLNDAPQFSQLIADLKQQLSHFLEPAGIAPAINNSNSSVVLNPTTMLAEVSQVPLVLVIDDRSYFTKELEASANHWRFQIEIAADLAIAQKNLFKTPPDAILLNLNLRNSVDDGLVLLQQLKELFPVTPILVVAEQDRLSDRVAVSRLGVRRFLPKPIAIAQVLEAIVQVLPKSQQTEAKVMLIDDDPVMLDVLCKLLQPWGLQVTTLQDPRQFWDVLMATEPNLLIIDLEMPEFSGIDLCRVVRQDSRYGNLPILVVTAHTDMQSIQQVFAAGADDFVGKPVIGPELVTRVISRIDRTRSHQELETVKRRIDT